MRYLNKTFPVLLFVIAFIFSSELSFSQAEKDTIWLDIDQKKVLKNKSFSYRLPSSKNDTLYEIKEFYKNGILKMQGFSIYPNEDYFEGKVTWYDKNGNEIKIANFLNNEMEGKCITFYDDEKLISYFEKGKLVSGKINSIMKSSRLFQEIRNDTLIEIFYEKDLKGIRGEQYKILGLEKPKLLIRKYYGENGVFIGSMEEFENDDTRVNVKVLYYLDPMRVNRIIYRSKNYRLGKTVFLPNGHLREKFENVPNPKILYYDKGKIINHLLLKVTDYGLVPWSGKRHRYYSDFDEDKVNLIKETKEYENGNLLKTTVYYENKQIKGFKENLEDGKQLEITYSEEGKEISNMIYKDGQPYEGMQSYDNSKFFYKDGNIVKKKGL